MKIVLNLKTELTAKQLSKVLENFNFTLLDDVVGGMLDDAIEAVGMEELSVWVEDIHMIDS